ncbi:hypothetical protein SEA_PHRAPPUCCINO_185 [Mycobacterium phage Phrappuccino]|uniref:Cyclic-phosphate processing Receiver domain-containing protein n=1 Tax=Mycobacterium phage Phrappuccino TaxID=2591223 RepID=A0A514DE25_9CAUD|nr:hypothetical protein KHQ87_gp185 [Mycobacterium phage Phrappuccino]QDH91860.1 hypothetical protein SEA_PHRAPPUCCINO_185 [Mycobacterium phage Phrappuccino]QIQ63326.1 hypothetical protein SEA_SETTECANDELA_210 [Mycobacterium phage Settecandela]
MKLWVDDERTPPEGDDWVWVLTVSDAIDVLTNTEVAPEVMSLDYVLKRGETADDILYWLKDQPADRWPTEILAHSSSAAARELIMQLVEDFRRAGLAQRQALTMGDLHTECPDCHERWEDCQCDENFDEEG